MWAVQRGIESVCSLQLPRQQKTSIVLNKPLESDHKETQSATRGAGDVVVFSEERTDILLLNDVLVYVCHVQNANQFDPDVVLNQLRYSGMLETVKIRRAGFPVRRTFKDFYSRSVNEYSLVLLLSTSLTQFKSVPVCAFFTDTR